MERAPTSLCEKGDWSFYQRIAAMWLESRAYHLQIPIGQLCSKINFGADSYGTFRAIRNGRRKWNVRDVCQIGKYFGQSPSAVLAQVESWFNSGDYEKWMEFRETLPRRRPPKPVEERRRARESAGEEVMRAKASNHPGG